jgi:hypothetical protein
MCKNEVQDCQNDYLKRFCNPTEVEMSTSKPQNPNPGNPGAVRLTRLGTLLPVGNQVSQIRGGAVAGSTSGGIPNHVTEVSARVSAASSGNTSTVTVTFHRDPSDPNFSQAKILIRGYPRQSWLGIGRSQ